jgi:hypothetical protein
MARKKEKLAPSNCYYNMQKTRQAPGVGGIAKSYLWRTSSVSKGDELIAMPDIMLKAFPPLIS